MEDDAARAFGFEGNWREYAPVALTNLLLIVVTLGLYRFWSKTRERRYLWSRTRFLDEPLEWTGEGLELFKGFLLVLLFFSIPFLIVNFGAQMLAFSGHPVIAYVLLCLSLLTIFYLTGLARLRALRYRLSRSWWHGIRGGADDNGLRYGVAHAWRTTAGYLPLGLLTPWAMTSLWNKRWNVMSFGTLDFSSDARGRRIFGQFMFVYFVPLLLVVLGIAAAGSVGGRFGAVIVVSNFPPVLRMLSLVVILLGVYILIGIIFLAWYAAFIREAVGNLRLGDAEFAFQANLDEWMGLFIKDALIVFFTAGIGWAFLGYRHWKFFITHLEMFGTIDVATLGQSMTKQPNQGEGLLDAFDSGAF
jgi:uncharacterized membrane protein YjgN (DUF898 family)